jgi:Domain of unknown function (DUF4042)
VNNDGERTSSHITELLQTLQQSSWSTYSFLQSSGRVLELLHVHGNVSFSRDQLDVFFDSLLSTISDAPTNALCSVMFSNLVRIAGAIIFSNFEKCNKYIHAALNTTNVQLKSVLSIEISNYRNKIEDGSRFSSLQALLVTLGTILIKMGTKQSMNAFEVLNGNLIPVLRWLSGMYHSKKLQDLSIARVLSSCLRAISTILQSGQVSTMKELGEGAAPPGEELLQLLHGLILFHIVDSNGPQVMSSNAHIGIKKRLQLKDSSSVASSWFSRSDSEDDCEQPDSHTRDDNLYGHTYERNLAIRVRVTTLHCLSNLSRIVPNAFIAQYSLFIPEIQATHPHPATPSLLTCILYDESRRVREAACESLYSVLSNCSPFEKFSPPSTMDASKPSIIRVKFESMVNELHTGLSRAVLSMMLSKKNSIEVIPRNSLKHPSLLCALIKASATAIAVIPPTYVKKHTFMTDIVHVVKLILFPIDDTDASLVPHRLVITALHTCGAIIVALSDKSFPRLVGTLDLRDDLIKHVIKFLATPSCQKTPNLRAETLALVNKITKIDPRLIVPHWKSSFLIESVLQTFSDPTPSIRVTSLKIINEFLHERSSLLSSKQEFDKFWLTLSDENLSRSLYFFLKTILLQAIHDPAAAVRSVAISCYSSLFPIDWYIGFLESDRSELVQSLLMFSFDASASTRMNGIEFIASIVQNSYQKCSYTKNIISWITDDNNTSSSCIVSWRSTNFYFSLIKILLSTVRSDDSQNIRVKGGWTLATLLSELDVFDVSDNIPVFTIASDDDDGSSWLPTDVKSQFLSSPHVCDNLSHLAGSKKLVWLLGLPNVRAITTEIFDCIHQNSSEKVIASMIRAMVVCLLAIYQHVSRNTVSIDLMLYERGVSILTSYLSDVAGAHGDEELVINKAKITPAAEAAAKMLLEGITDSDGRRPEWAITLDKGKSQ